MARCRIVSASRCRRITRRRGGRGADVRVNVEGDVTVSAADVTATETDTTVDVELASVVSGAATDLDGSEQLTALTIEFSSLPQDTAAYGSATLLGNVLTVTLNADGTLPDILVITLPADYSTAGVAGSIVNDGAPITYTVSVTSDEGGEATSAAYDLTVNVEGDVTVSAADVTATETDTTVDVELASVVSGAATDLDGSEQLTALTIEFSSLPQDTAAYGSATLLGNVLTVTLNADGTLPDSFGITLPADYSTAGVAGSIVNDGAPITYTVSVTSDEGGEATSAAYDLTVNVEGDLTGSVGDVSYNEDVGSIPLSLSLDVTDIDNSEDVNSITVTFSGLPEGADVNGGSLVNNVWTGSEAELEALTLTNIAADFSDDISGTLTATTDEGGSFTSDFTITGHAQPDGEPDSASALEAVHTV